ncbi:16S rRNA (guanine1207-N2)-methyltransferase/23S rRNA (guanine1835-N2)-methyltransferase [Arsukibacterium tuosuense]|uniref:Ribosomal RNA large subunit methyltransferase G n=1 Tax=Arsukibacterium tuosuense TaxID=1323745 RepID=A0A285IYJ0_9GAMM|nr:methyltransferase [Arsukibacterium tuosuense]SNY53028.1 16S rRNA (guanine1207-N2)-methyltransferase/23S rRNA (guanine1835-N2)-methyltransferase [Arsukibacterium tuosuense]
MNTQFQFGQINLTLHRWPLNQPNHSLQAWDAADELLIDAANTAIADFTATHSATPNVLLVNDSFGALSCALAHCRQTSSSDSFLAQQAVLHNRTANGIDNQAFSSINSLQPLPDNTDIVLLKLPNNHSYLRFILSQLAAVVRPDTIILAAAKAKEINRNVLDIFATQLGQAEASLAVKKCRLIRCQPEPGKPQPHFPLQWPLEDTDFTLINHANVFAREKLDLGARFLLQHLPQDTTGQRIIDLGCGNGVLGLTLLADQPGSNLVFTDESYMAVASAKANIELNMPQCYGNSEFVVDDCLASQQDQSADQIICNPPFHQQHTVTSHIATQMFTEAKRVLKQGGRLRIVANRHLNYQQQLQRLFGHCQQLAANPKFVILEAIKRS